MRKRLEHSIFNAIKRIGEKLNKYPYYFVNEEDIRTELYRKLSTHFKHKIKLKSGKDIIRSNAIHCDAIIIDKKIHKPDLLIYYTNKERPI